jgi:hypothetical protein
MVPKFQVGTAGLSCSPVHLNSSKLSPVAAKPLKSLFYITELKSVYIDPTHTVENTERIYSQISAYAILYNYITTYIVKIAYRYTTH